MSRQTIRSVCVFCGSNPGTDPRFSIDAQRVGEILADRGMTLVYGGGAVGLMGAVARGVLSRGGRAIGVIPHALVARELAHNGLTDLRIVATMHERKALMVDLSDAFITLPGGFGTFDELFEMLSWRQLGIHSKPCVLLNTSGYFDRLLDFLDRACHDGLLRPEFRAALAVCDTPERSVDLLFEAPTLRTPAWVHPDDR